MTTVVACVKRGRGVNLYIMHTHLMLLTLSKISNVAMQMGNNLGNRQYNPKKLTLAFLNFIYLNKLYKLGPHGALYSSRLAVAPLTGQPQRQNK